MRKITLITLLLVVSQNILIAQKVKKVKNINERAQTSEIYYVLKDSQDIRHGEYLYKYKGKTQVKGQFENNYAVGKWIYTTDEDFRIEGNFLNNKKSGEWKYYKSNKLISEIIYDNGVLNGKAVGYYENGNLASETSYKNGLYNGEYKAYYKNGETKEISFYKNGKPDGDLERFDEEGNLLYRITYKNGIPFDLEVVKDNEDVFYAGNLKNGTGEFIEYAMSKDNDEKYIISIKTFKDGKLHGPVKGYDLEGELFYRGQYMDDYMVGMWEFYLNNKKKYFSQAYNFNDSLKEDTTKWFTKAYKDDLGLFGELPGFDNSNADQFRYHIAKTLVYPRIAQEFGISGRVYVQFKVDELGLVKDVKLLNNVDKHLDMEALRVVKSSPLWVPGFKDQLPVDTGFTFPIVFQLR